MKRMLEQVRRSLAARILAGFTVTAILALGLSLASLAYVDSVNKNASRTTEELQVVTRNVLQLRLTVNQQSDAVRGFLLASANDEAAYLDDYAVARRQFGDAMTALRLRTPDSESTNLLNDITTQDREFKRIADDEIDLRRQGYPVSSLDLWQTAGKSSKDTLLAAVDRYSLYQDSRFKAALDQDSRESSWVLTIAMQLVIAAASGGVLVGVIVTQQIIARIRALARASRRIAEGDFEVRLADFGVDEVGSLADAMNQMAWRLGQGREALQTSLNRIGTLNEVAAAVDSSLDVSDVVAVVLDNLGRFVRFESAAVFLYNDRGQPIRFAGRNWDATLDDLIADTSTMLPPTSAPSWSAVRLNAHGSAIGLLAVTAPPESPFGDDDRQAIELFSRQVAAAVDNARLHEQTEQDLLAQRKLREVVQRLSGQLNLAALLDELVNDAVELLNASGGSIALLEGGALVIRAVHNENRDRIGTVLPAGVGVMGLVLERQVPVVVDDYHRDVPLPVLDDERVRGCLAVPIERQDDIVGAFSVFSYDADRHFTDRDRESLTLFAGHAAVAIENARLYESSVALGVADERNRMAREIHDTLAQGLTAIALQLDTVDILLERSRGEPARDARAHVKRARQLAQANMDEARRSVLDLRAAPLEGAGLGVAIEKLTRQLAQDRDLALTIRGVDLRHRHPARIEAGLYRIAQEAIGNAVRHADARHLTIDLREDGGRIDLIVTDDGQGFDPDGDHELTARGGFGLTGMRERTALLGGSISVTSAPGGGTRVHVSVPDGSRSLAGSTR